nr:MAG TPA: hypothetical protein [Caudoviricetes sp.]
MPDFPFPAVQASAPAFVLLFGLKCHQRYYLQHRVLHRLMILTYICIYIINNVAKLIIPSEILILSVYLPW